MPVETLRGRKLKSPGQGTAAAVRTSDSAFAAVVPTVRVAAIYAKTSNLKKARMGGDAMNRHPARKSRSQKNRSRVFARMVQSAFATSSTANGASA